MRLVANNARLANLQGYERSRSRLVMFGGSLRNSCVKLPSSSNKAWIRPNRKLYPPECLPSNIDYDAVSDRDSCDFSRAGGLLARFLLASEQAQISLSGGYTSSPTRQTLWDVVGLGQSMVDLLVQVDDAALEDLGVHKGHRRVIDMEQKAAVLEKLAGWDSKVSTGGSLANTLLNLSRLGSTPPPHGLPPPAPLRVCFAGCLGSDMLGSYFEAQMRGSGVHVVPLHKDGQTGTVIVASTPDAQRSFLSFFTSEKLQMGRELQEMIQRSRMLVIEGYMLEMGHATETLWAAIATARSHGTLVVLSAGDAGVVSRKRATIWQAIDLGVDVFFANTTEAQELLGQQLSAEDAARKLAVHLPMAVVTDGSSGSHIAAMGQLYTVPPFWAKDPPVDTCGAGDAYAAGVLYGLLQGYDVPTMGFAGARVASAVIAHLGAHLPVEDVGGVVSAIQMRSHTVDLHARMGRADGNGLSVMEVSKGQR